MEKQNESNGKEDGACCSTCTQDCNVIYIHEKVLDNGNNGWYHKWPSTIVKIPAQNVEMVNDDVDINSSKFKDGMSMRYYYTGVTYCIKEVEVSGNLVKFIGVSRCNTYARVQAGYTKTIAKQQVTKRIPYDKAILERFGHLVKDVEAGKEVTELVDVEVLVPRYEHRSDQFCKKTGKEEALRSVNEVIELAKGDHCASRHRSFTQDFLDWLIEIGKLRKVKIVQCTRDGIVVHHGYVRSQPTT